MAIIYACLVVRSYFLGEAESNLAYAGVMLSRATLCEILAMKLLGNFAQNQIQLVAGELHPRLPWMKGKLMRDLVLTTGWNPLAGAPANIIEEVKQTLGSEYDAHDPQSALEVRPYLLRPRLANLI